MKAARGPSQRDKGIQCLAVRWLFIVQERSSVIQELEIKLMLRSDRDSGWRYWPESRHMAQSKSLSMGRSTWGGGAGRGGAGATGKNFVGIQVLSGSRENTVVLVLLLSYLLLSLRWSLKCLSEPAGWFLCFPRVWLCLEIGQAELAGASLG